MGVYKEHIHELERLANTQRYIFLDDEGNPEAMDTGLIDTLEIRNTIQELLGIDGKEYIYCSLPDVKFTNIRGLCNEVIGRKATSTIWWEMPTRHEHGNGTKVEICWFPKRDRHPAYYTVDLKNCH